MCPMTRKLRNVLFGRKVMFCSQDIQVFVFSSNHDLRNSLSHDEY